MQMSVALFASRNENYNFSQTLLDAKTKKYGK